MRKILTFIVVAFVTFISATADAQEFKIRDGWFVEGDIGVFFTIGGVNGISNASPYTGFEVGYDLSRNVNLQFTWGYGGVANNAVVAAPENPGPEEFVAPDNYSVMVFDVGGSYTHYFWDRVALLLKLGVGGTKVASPIMDPQSSVLMNVMFGTGVEMQTKMKHIKLGVELTGVMIMSDPSVLGLAICPTLKYVF